MLLNLIKKLIGTLSDEDKKALKKFLEDMLTAAAAGAVQGATKR